MPRQDLIKELKSSYAKRKIIIKQRLKDFRKLSAGCDETLFGELCFCIFTPQSKATLCDEAVSKLKKHNLLLDGSLDSVRPHLQKVRFPNNKARFLLEARDSLKDETRCIKLKSRIDKKRIKETREWLVKNIKGLGYKEASHFLRNIGFGKDLAILDVHIIKNLIKYGVLDSKPKTLTKKTYLEIEEKVENFSKKIGIPMEELDLLFWSAQTGFVFK